MAYQVFRFNPSEHQEYVPGRPQGPITDAGLADIAHAEGVRVEALMHELAAYKRADGKPLYVETPKAKDELGEVTPAAEPEAPRKRG